MILDTPLDIKGPYCLKGTADIYFSGGKWIARSWPQRPKQPNSYSQISAREKFAAMLSLRVSLPEEEIKLWRNATWPPGKTWDDAWRSNMLKWFHLTDTIIPYRPFQVATLISTQIIFPSHPPAWRYGLGWSVRNDEFCFLQYLPTNAWLLSSSPSRVLWDVNGLLCFAGKKVVPHFYPSAPGMEISSYVEAEYEDQIFWGALSPSPSGLGVFGSTFPSPLRWTLPGYIVWTPEIRVSRFDRCFTWGS